MLLGKVSWKKWNCTCLILLLMFELTSGARNGMYQSLIYGNYLEMAMANAVRMEMAPNVIKFSGNMSNDAINGLYFKQDGAQDAHVYYKQADKAKFIYWSQKYQVWQIYKKLGGERCYGYLNHNVEYPTLSERLWLMHTMDGSVYQSDNIVLKASNENAPNENYSILVKKYVRANLNGKKLTDEQKNKINSFEVVYNNLTLEEINDRWSSMDIDMAVPQTKHEILQQALPHFADLAKNTHEITSCIQIFYCFLGINELTKLYLDPDSDFTFTMGLTKLYQIFRQLGIYMMTLMLQILVPIYYTAEYTSKFTTVFGENESLNERIFLKSLATFCLVYLSQYLKSNLKEENDKFEENYRCKLFPKWGLIFSCVQNAFSTIFILITTCILFMETPHAMDVLLNFMAVTFVIKSDEDLANLCKVDKGPHHREDEGIDSLVSYLLYGERTFEFRELKDIISKGFFIFLSLLTVVLGCYLWLAIK